MPFTLSVLVVAVGLAYLRGGRLHRLAAVPLRWSWLLLAGVALQVVLDIGAGRGLFEDASTGGWLLLLASQLLVLGWIAANIHLPGTVLILIGLILNAVVIAANGAMPVSADAMAAIGADAGTTPTGKHTLLTDQTRLPWLADIIPLAPLRSIISVGDIVLAAGLIPLAHGLMSHRTAEERSPQLTDGPTAGSEGDQTGRS